MTKKCIICLNESKIFTTKDTCQTCYTKKQRNIHKDKISKRNKKYYSTPKGRFNNARSTATNKNKTWNLTLIEYENFIKNPCFYCGGKLTPFGSGLDREDNSVGYEIRNVIPCCGFCNRLRGDLISVAEMMVLVDTLKDIRKMSNIWEGFITNERKPK